MPYGRTQTSIAAAVELIELFVKQLTMSKLKPGEVCIILTDTAFNPAYAAACLGAALQLGAEAYQVTFPTNKPLPSKTLAPAWREADLITYMTTTPMHYRPEIREALDHGARVLCVMQPLHVLQRLTADPEVRRRTRAGAALLDVASTIQITSAAGTDLVMDKTGRRGLAHYGAADEPGHLDFWGGGMVETAQLEGTLEGRLVLDTGDCIFHLGRFVEQPVTIEFREGRVASVTGGLDAFLLRSYFDSFGDDSALMAGHTSWGTDHRARWHAPLVQFPDAGAGGADTEAYYGNIQVEIGSNNDISFGGKNVAASHLGLCTLNASLSLDGRPIIERGKFVVDELR